jgi:hypothetical protein
MNAKGSMGLLERGDRAAHAAEWSVAGGMPVLLRKVVEGNCGEMLEHKLRTWRQTCAT